MIPPLPLLPDATGAAYKVFSLFYYILDVDIMAARRLL
jgi:hypothetical protein